MTLLPRLDLTALGLEPGVALKATPLNLALRGKVCYGLGCRASALGPASTPGPQQGCTGMPARALLL
jgi:hypothetical protein